MSRRKTCDSAVIKKAKHERKYGTHRQMTTESNRRRKRLKHLREHPNNIKGMEHIRKALGLT